MADSDDPARGDGLVPDEPNQDAAQPPRDDVKDSPGMPGGTLGTGGTGRDHDR